MIAPRLLVPPAVSRIRTTRRRRPRPVAARPVPRGARSIGLRERFTDDRHALAFKAAVLAGLFLAMALLEVPL